MWHITNINIYIYNFAFCFHNKKKIQQQHACNYTQSIRIKDMKDMKMLIALDQMNRDSSALESICTFA